MSPGLMSPRIAPRWPRWPRRTRRPGRVRPGNDFAGAKAGEEVVR